MRFFGDGLGLLKLGELSLHFRLAAGLCSFFGVGFRLGLRFASGLGFRCVVGLRLFIGVAFLFGVRDRLLLGVGGRLLLGVGDRFLFGVGDRLLFGVGERRLFGVGVRRLFGVGVRRLLGVGVLRLLVDGPLLSERPRDTGRLRDRELLRDRLRGVRLLWELRLRRLSPRRRALRLPILFVLLRRLRLLVRGVGRGSRCSVTFVVVSVTLRPKFDFRSSFLRLCSARSSLLSALILFFGTTSSLGSLVDFFTSSPGNNLRHCK